MRDAAVIVGAASARLLRAPFCVVMSGELDVVFMRPDSHVCLLAATTPLNGYRWYPGFRGVEVELEVA